MLGKRHTKYDDCSIDGIKEDFHYLGSAVCDLITDFKELRRYNDRKIREIVFWPMYLLMLSCMIIAFVGMSIVNAITYIFITFRGILFALLAIPVVAIMLPFKWLLTWADKSDKVLNVICKRK